MSKQEVLMGYKGIIATNREWLFILRDDSRIMSVTGRHDVAMILSQLLRQYAARLIGAGC